MNLSLIARRDVVVVEANGSIDKAIALMEEHGIRHLPVVEQDTPVGMVSDRDVMSSVGWISSRDRISSQTGSAVSGPRLVSEIMSAPVFVLPLDDPIERAGALMLEKRISAIPLVNRDERLAGIVTEYDFLSCYFDERPISATGKWRFNKVSEQMRAQVFSVAPKATFAEVIRLMKEKQIRHLPVVERRRVLGIVSDHDVRKALGRRQVDGDDSWTEFDFGTHVSQLMRSDVESIRPDATLAETAQRMVGRKIGALPVSDGGVLTGIITETDLLRVLMSALKS